MCLHATKELPSNALLCLVAARSTAPGVGVRGSLLIKSPMYVHKTFFASSGSAVTRRMCGDCGRIHAGVAAVGGGCCGKPCAGDARAPSTLQLRRDFVTEGEEADLIAAFTGDGGAPATSLRRWKWAVGKTTGLRRMGIGPSADFPRRRIREAKSEVFAAHGFPPEVHPLLRRCAGLAEAASTPGTSPDEAAATARPFVPIQVNANDYAGSGGGADPGAGNLDPHVDEPWIWGERVVGVSLGADAAITFIPRPACASDGTPEAACVAAQGFKLQLPRRSAFVMAGAARHEWLHGIAAADVAGRRLSLTVRELAGSLLAEPSPLLRRCLVQGAACLSK